MGQEFRFYSRLNLVELLGVRASTVAELARGIGKAPGSSIYYHTHRFLEQHHFLSPEPPNDFAFWVTNNLGLDVLGEKLASIDTIKYRKIKDLKCCFSDILEAYLQHDNFSSVRCEEGEEFHFMSCRTFVLPTPHVAHDLRQFLECLKEVSIHSLYFHIFEARLRLERGENDFSNWFESLNHKKLADEVARLDPYTITLEGLRKKIIELIRKQIES